MVSPLLAGRISCLQQTKLRIDQPANVGQNEIRNLPVLAGQARHPISWNED